MNLQTRVHKVEDQWHYPILKAAGWSPVTPTGTGFVRSYEYVHANRPGRIRTTTGASADYWHCAETGAFGYWADLAPHLARLSQSLTASCPEAIIDQVQQLY